MGNFAPLGQMGAEVGFQRFTGTFGVGIPNPNFEDRLIYKTRMNTEDPDFRSKLSNSHSTASGVFKLNILLDARQPVIYMRSTFCPCEARSDVQDSKNKTRRGINLEKKEF